MSQALYRKYRSRGFDEIVGQSHVTDLLQAAVTNGTFSHAYLFTGPRGTGKTSVARILAHAINDLPYTDDAVHLDIIEIDAASNRRIDDIRDLREKVFIAPSSAKYKVYIIDEVHMLTSESFNALLKTLEEPPEHVVFILATTELHKVPATIVSRTQRFHFRPGSPSDVAAHLRSIADAEHIAIDDAALTLIAEHSEGGFRDSVSLLDQVSNLGSGENVTAQLVESLLGLAPSERIESIVDDIAAGRNDDAVRTIHQLFDEGTSPQTVSAQMIRQLSQRATDIPVLYSLLNELIEVPRSYTPQLKLLAVIGQFRRIAQAPIVVPTVQPSQPVARQSAPRPAPSAAQPRVVAETPVTTAAAQPAPEPIAATTAAAISDIAIDWSAVLAELQKRAPTLHSIVKRAETTIDEHGITLAFGFALHRKKMQDEKHRSQLVNVITNLYGACPVITVLDTKSTLNETAKSVADIMGGGEAVTV